MQTDNANTDNIRSPSVVSSTYSKVGLPVASISVPQLDIPQDQEIPNKYVNSHNKFTDSKGRLHINSLSADCLTVPVQFGQSVVDCIIDSGATTCVIREEIYDLLPSSVKPPLLKYHGTICGINGPAPRLYAQTVMPFRIHDTVFLAETLVSDIRPPVLIGRNFLKEHKVSVMHGDGIIQIGDISVTLVQNSKSKPIKLAVANNVIVSPNSETFVHLKSVNKLTLPDLVMCSPLQRIASATGLVGGRSLVIHRIILCHFCLSTHQMLVSNSMLVKSCFG